MGKDNKVARWLTAGSARRNVIVGLSALALAGCTASVSNLDTQLLEIGSNTPDAAVGQESLSETTAVTAARPAAVVPEGSSDGAEPAIVATNALAPSQADTAAQTIAAVEADTPSSEPVSSEVAVSPTASLANEGNAVANTRIAQANAAPTANPVAPTSSNAPAQVAAAPSNASGQQAQSGGLFNRLFSRNRAAPKPSAEVPSARTTVAASTTASSTPSAPRPTVVVASASGLPGVDRERVIGINKQDDERPVVQVASAAGLARLAPNGLRKQHSGVDVKCLKPALVRVLKQAERKFGKPVVVTSGYRSPRRNANARGAKNSLHMYCAAADVQIAGVSKWELAAYLRSMPGRGGVGTYCHTKSVHVDIGPKRDWNWRCRRG